MTTHYHLLLAATCAGLSRAMHLVNGVYAQAFNRRHGRTGHLFGARFSARTVEMERHQRAPRIYILNNPVRAGLCDTADGWTWARARVS